MGREVWGLAEVKWRKIVCVSENFRIFAVAGIGCCLLYNVIYIINYK